MCINVLIAKHGSTCIDISLHTRRESYLWQLGQCHASFQYSRSGLYTEKCCIQNGDHILSCKNNKGDGWVFSVVKIGQHQFCDDFVGYSKSTKINIPGRTERAISHKYIFLIYCKKLYSLKLNK